MVLEGFKHNDGQKFRRTTPGNYFKSVTITLLENQNTRTLARETAWKIVNRPLRETNRCVYASVFSAQIESVKKIRDL